MASHFETAVNDYVTKYAPKIHIMTPCYGGVCYANYTMALMNTIDTLKNFNIRYQVDFCCNDSLVSRARNNMVARAMSDPEMTHAMFIDADITWHPHDILKLLISDQYLIGGIYPLKKYNFEKVAKDPSLIQKWMESQKSNHMYRDYPPEHHLQQKLLDYNVSFHDETLVIENNISQVKHIACGFMLMKRKMIELMQEAFPSTKYTDDVCFLKEKQNEQAYALFDCGVENGAYLSEDWMFCSRWEKMGGKCFVDVTINLTHTGVEHYQGSFLSSVMG